MKTILQLPILLAVYFTITCSVKAQNCDSVPTVAGVIPFVVSGNPTACDLGYTNGFKIDGYFEGTFYMKNATNVSLYGCNKSDSVAIDKEAYIIIKKSGDSEHQSFSFEASPNLVIEQVIVKGGSRVMMKSTQLNSVANIYDYTGLNISGDSGLHAATKADCQYFDISHIDFAFSKISTVKTCHSATAHYSAKKLWNIQEIALEDSIYTVAGGTFTTPFTTTLTEAGFEKTNYTLDGVITIHNTLLQAVRIDSIAPIIENGSITAITYSVNHPDLLKPDESITCNYSAEINGELPGEVTFQLYGSATISSGSAITTVTEDSIAGEVANASVTVYRNGTILGTSAGSTTWESNEIKTYNYPASSYYEFGQSTILETGQSAIDSSLIICKKPEINVFTSTSLEKTHHWSIKKSVDNDTLSMITGQNDQVVYTVSVKQDSISNGYITEGIITVINPMNDQTVYGTLNAMVNDQKATITGTGYNGSVVLYPGQEKMFPFTIRLDGISANTSLVTTLAIGSTEFMETSEITIPQSGYDYTARNESITVEDTYNGMIWADVTSDSEWTYSRTIDETLAAEGDIENGIKIFNVPNTASIIETGQSKSATVNVTYYYPVINQDMTTTFNRDSRWEITAGSDPEIHTNPDETTEITYTVNAKKLYIDTEFRIDGLVSLSNPSPAEPMLVIVKDLFNNHDITFNEITPGDTLLIQPGESINLTYSYTTDEKPLQQQNSVVLEVNNQIIEDKITKTLNDGDAIITETANSITISDNIGLITDEPLTTSTILSVTRTYETPVLEDENYVNGEQSKDWNNTFVINENGLFSEVNTRVHYYIPVLGKTVTPNLLNKFDWNITKTASVEQLHLFAGEEAVIDYEIQVEKIPTASFYALNGAIQVTNPNPEADMFITLFEQVNGSTVSLDGLGSYGYAVIPHSTTKTFTYQLTWDEKPLGGTAMTFMDNGYYDQIINKTFSFEGIDSVTETVYDKVTVTDKQCNKTWNNVEGSTTLNCSRRVEFNVPTTVFNNGIFSYTLPNTATIDELNKSANANVEITYYAPIVSQNCSASFDKNYIWTAEKTSDNTSYSVKNGETIAIPFTVIVDAISQETNHRLSGSITVSNTHPTRSMGLEIMDQYNGQNIALTSSMVLVPAASDQTILLNQPISDLREAYNTVSASLNDVSFISSEYVTVDGPTTASASQVVVMDNMLSEPLGTVSAHDQLPVYFSYHLQKGPLYTDSIETINNIVSLVGENGTTIGQSTCTVSVHIIGDVTPPTTGYGCTLTPGYWKTHSKESGKYDLKWTNLPDMDKNGVTDFEKEKFFMSDLSYLEVISSTTKGSCYIILGRAFGAAYLNILAGADRHDIATEFQFALELLNNYTRETAETERNSFISTATVLDNFNNGIIGPGHCNDVNRKSLTTNDIIPVPVQNIETSICAYPNPSVSEVNFKIALTESACVKIEIYDVMGTLKEILMDECIEAQGLREIQIPFTKIEGSTYFYRITINGKVQSGSLLPSK